MSKRKEDSPDTSAQPDDALSAEETFSVELADPVLQTMPDGTKVPVITAKWAEDEVYPLRWFRNTDREYDLGDESDQEELANIMAAYSLAHGMEVYVGPAVDIEATNHAGKLVVPAGRKMGLYVDPIVFAARSPWLVKDSITTPQGLISEFPEAYAIEDFAEDLESARIKLEPAIQNFG